MMRCWVFLGRLDVSVSSVVVLDEYRGRVMVRGLEGEGESESESEVLVLLEGQIAK